MILVISPSQSQYNVYHDFAASLNRAFNRQGADSILVDANQVPKALEQKHPDLIVSFNIVEANQSLIGSYLKIPFLFYCMDSPDYYFDFVKNPYFFLSIRDRSSIDMFDLGLRKKIFFLPHAADKDIKEGSSHKEYPVVYFGTAMNESSIKTRLKEMVPDIFLEAIDRACDLFFDSKIASYHNCLVQAIAENKKIKRSDLENADSKKLFQALDLIIRAKDRIRLLNSIKNTEVHIFGSSFENSGWEEINGNNKIFHDPLPFSESLEIVKRSKIVLNSIPTIQEGGHERIFYGYLCGALPFTNESRYLDEQFKGSLPFFKDYEQIDEKILSLLKEDKTRKQMIQEGSEIVKRHHTWDVRAKTIYDLKRTHFLV